MVKYIFIFVVLYLGNVKLSDVSFYEILGVTKHATTQEIKQAYKKLAVKLHPDKNPNSADQKTFLKITEAYETLKDTEKRHKYNLYGSQQSYTRQYDHQSQREYDNLYYNGLYHKDMYVVTLSPNNFNSYMNDGFYFINFYSPFCRPCQNLADHWKKLAEAYKGIINVAAVNCKYHNSFCYNAGISSYPSLRFYPYGKNGNNVVYRGAHRFDSLEEFVMMYIKSKVNVVHVSQIQNVDKPIAYVVDSDSLYNDAATRIAYHLKGLATVVIAKDNVRRKLTSDPETVVVFRYKDVLREIDSTDEKSIVKEIVQALPRIENIGLDKLKKIRNNLRNGHQTAWVFYFTKKGDDYMLLHQLKNALPHLNYGEIDCDALGELCNSLQAEATPTAGVLKPGGAYQYLWESAPAYVADAVEALSLHTLSSSDLNNILDGDMSMWVLLVVPHGASWESHADPFTQASVQLMDTDIHFGIMACTQNTNQYCQMLTRQEPAIVVQNRTARHYYNGHLERDNIIEFIQLLKDTDDLELTEEQAIDVASRREQNWVIAYMPANCGRTCDQLLHEWRIAAKRMVPLRDVADGVRVGAVRCAQSRGALCGNVRAAAARLYPINRREHYAVSLQQLSQAPYILEWIFDLVADSITKLNWQLFSRFIVSEELNPSSNKKPWLVYFHSPRCYHCYEMFPEFATVSILLKDSMLYGKVDCVSEQSVCRAENVRSYPSLRLYLPRGAAGPASVRAISVRDFADIIQDIKPHLARYDVNLLANIDMVFRSHIRDEL